MERRGGGLGWMRKGDRFSFRGSWERVWREEEGTAGEGGVRVMTTVLLVEEMITVGGGCDTSGMTEGRPEGRKEQNDGAGRWESTRKRRSCRRRSGRLAGR